MPTTYAIPNGRTVMDATLYTGTGAVQSINNSDLGTTGFKPDYVWAKQRNGAANWRNVDSVRGTSSYIFSSLTNAAVTDTNALTSFNSNGFSLGSNQINDNGATMVAYQWQAGQGTTSSNTNGSITSTVSVNATAGFSIVSWAGGQGSNYTIGHGLGVTPSFFITKQINGADNWGVYYRNNGVNTNWMLLNTTAAQGPQNGSLAGGAYVVFSSSTIQIDSSSYANDGSSMIGYCWAPVAGFSQFGSYTGNGSTDGPFVYTGFRPKFIMVKVSSAVESWYIADSSRDTYNVASQYLIPNSSAAEGTTAWIDFLSNGFKLRYAGGGVNVSSATYIYAAFAENPTKFANAR